MASQAPSTSIKIGGDAAEKLTFDDIAVVLSAIDTQVIATAGYVSIPKDEYAALLLLAQRGIDSARAAA